MIFGDKDNSICNNPQMFFSEICTFPQIYFAEICTFPQMFEGSFMAKKQCDCNIRATALYQY